MRRALALAAGVLAALPVTGMSAPSWAEAPTWDAAYNNGLVPDDTQNYQVTGPTGAYSPASGGFRYCPGDGLLVTQVTASYRRQHATARNSTFVRVGGGMGPAGATWQRADNDAGYATGTWYSTGPVNFSPQSCAFGGVEIFGSGNVAGTPRWNVNLQGVVIQDGVAPGVSGLAVPGGWQTGPFEVSWWSSDNGDYDSAPWGDTGARIAGGDDGNLGPDAPGVHDVVLDPEGLADGAHSVAAYRAGGGWPTAWTPEATVYTDQNPPVPSGFSHRLDTGGVLHFGWNAADGAGSGTSQTWVEYSQDGTNWDDLGAPDGGAAANVAVTMEQGDAGLDDGMYWWRVSSEDQAGNYGEFPAAGRFRIDLTEPDVTDVESTLVDGDDTRRRVRFTASDPGGIGFAGAPAFVIMTRADDGEEWVERYRGATVAGVNTALVDTHAMPVGRYDTLFSVTDAAGNEAQEEFQAGDPEAIVVDREAPQVTATAIRYLDFPGARLSWKVTDPNDGVGLSATGPPNVRIEVEDPAGGGTWTTLHHAAHAGGAGSADVRLDAIAPGRHRGRISVTDRLGHASTEVFAFDVIRDEVAPEVSGITLTPVEFDLADLTFTVSDGPDGVGVDPDRPLTVECNTDGTWHQAIDLNASASTEVGPDGEYTRQIPLTVCPTGESTLTQGIRLRVRDRSGNTTEVVADGGAYSGYPHQLFMVDKLMPDVTATQVEALADGTGRARFRFDITDPAPSLLYLPGDRAEIRVEDTLATPAVWRLVESVDAADGPVDVTVPLGAVNDQQLTRWQVIVADRMGNTRTWTSPHNALRVDRTGPVASNPVLTIPGGPGGEAMATGDLGVGVDLTDGSPVGAGTSVDPVARFQARIDGGWVTLAQGAATDGHLVLTGSTLGQPDGRYPSRLVVDDLLHNTRANATGTLLVDHTAPDIADLHATLLPGQRLEVSFTLDEPGIGLPAGHQVVIDGEAPDGSWRELDRFAATDGPYRRVLDASGVKEGSPSIRVHAWDRARRERVAVARASVDRTPPRIMGITTTYPGVGVARVCANLTAGAGTDVAGELAVARRVGDEWVPAGSAAAVEGRNCLNLEIAGWGDGAHTLRLSFQDRAANQVAAFTTVALDATAPVISGLGVGAEGTTATVTYTVTDAGSGVDPDGAVVYLAPTSGGHPTGPWVDVWHDTLTPGGEQQAAIDLAHHRGQTVALKVHVADRAGNHTEAVAHLDLTSTGPKNRAVRVPRLRLAQDLKALNPFAQVEVLPDGSARVSAVPGEPVVLAGEVTDEDGAALAGQQITIDILPDDGPITSAAVAAPQRAVAKTPPRQPAPLTNLARQYAAQQAQQARAQAAARVARQAEARAAAQARAAAAQARAAQARARSAAAQAAKAAQQARKAKTAAAAAAARRVQARATTRARAQLRVAATKRRASHAATRRARTAAARVRTARAQARAAATAKTRVAHRAALVKCATNQEAQSAASRDAGAFLTVVCPVKTTTVIVQVKGGNRVKAELGIGCPHWMCSSVPEVAGFLRDGAVGASGTAWDLGKGIAHDTVTGAKFVLTHPPDETLKIAASRLIHQCDAVYRAGGGRVDCMVTMFKDHTGITMFHNAAVCMGRTAADGDGKAFGECTLYAALVAVPAAKVLRSGVGKVAARRARTDIAGIPVNTPIQITNRAARPNGDPPPPRPTPEQAETARSARAHLEPDCTGGRRIRIKQVGGCDEGPSRARQLPGATPQFLARLEQAANKIPAEWGLGTPAKKQTGWRWLRPWSSEQKHKKDYVRIDQGDPNSRYPVQRVDHVQVIYEGKLRAADGSPVPENAKSRPEAHIPLDVWLKWDVWYGPTAPHSAVKPSMN